MSDPRHAAYAVRQVVRGRSDWLTAADLDAFMNDVSAAVALPEMTIAVARDAHGRPLAVAALVIDDTVALLNGALATCHDARWALHDYLVRILIDRRVRYLFADGGGLLGALGLTTNLQSYQRLLGYELRHVRPARAHNRRRVGRLAAGLVLLAG